ncbi:MAG: lysylphosphatidylglycerol synthase transmembrane domain-containing protein [Bacteroidota bacterium]|nr:lysylphosphatidylglycerol synthase transmembrane domain-containing protein [Bacteroidota bacterium]
MKKKYISLALFLVGIIIIIVMIYNLGWQEIITDLKKTGWWIIPIILSRLLMYPLNTFAWRSVTYYNKEEKNKVSWLRMFRLTISGYAINYITPVMALGGEPYRIMAIKKDLGTKRATSSVLTYAMMHILSHFVFWIIGFLLLFAYFLSTNLEINTYRRIILICGMVFILISIVAIIFILKAYRYGVIERFFSFLKKIPYIKNIIKKRLTPEKQQSIAETDNQFKELFNNHRRAFYTSLFYETLSRVLSCAEVMLVMWAIAGVGSIGLVQAIIINALSSLIANIIFIFPMQVGIREGGLSMALALIGGYGKLGVFVGMILRISELAWIIIGMVMIKVKRFNNKKDGK